jgi:hypothetical protein
MRRRPAPMASVNAPTACALVYDYDWLANQTEWTDDARRLLRALCRPSVERQRRPELQRLGPALRPSALYLSTNIREPAATYNAGVDRGGYVTLTTARAATSRR